MDDAVECPGRCGLGPALKQLQRRAHRATLNLFSSADAVEPQKKKLFASPGSGHEKAGATSASPIAEKPLAEAAKLDATSASPTFSSSTTSPAMSAARPATAAVVAPARVFDGANKPFDSDSDDEGPARRRVVRKAALQKRVHSFDESDDSGSNSDAPSVARTSITKKKAKRSAAPVTLYICLVARSVD